MEGLTWGPERKRLGFQEISKRICFSVETGGVLRQKAEDIVYHCRNSSKNFIVEKVRTVSTFPVSHRAPFTGRLPASIVVVKEFPGHQ